MDGALARLYERLDGLYFLVFVLAASVVAFSLLTVVSYVAVVQYLGLPISDFVHVWVRGLVGIEAGVLVAAATVLPRSWPAIQWMRGIRAPEHATQAWEAAVRIPTLLTWAGPLPLAIGAAPAIVGFRDIAQIEWFNVLAITVGAIVVMALGIALTMVACEVIMRPVLAEIDTAFPRSGIDARVPSSSLRRRIVVSSLLVVYISAWLAMGLTAQTTDPARRLGLTIVAGVTISITFGLVLTLALSRSLFRPLKDLMAATRRVSAGELATRVPLLSRNELGDLARSFNEMTTGLAEREALRSALGVYVDPEVAARVLDEGEILSGEEAIVTIMFVDIIGFSTRAEMLPADMVCNELNEFFGLVVPVVEDQGGHTNKLIGDGLMAVFGAPLKLEDHADRALAAACAIQEGLTERYDGTLRAGVGLHTGSVVVGTMGGGRKLDFTLVGDAVNVASRVEELTRETGDTILLTEATRDALRANGTALAPRGSAAIRGRSEPVSLFAVISRIPA